MPLQTATNSATYGSFTQTAPGTYQWVAVYSGDQNNVGATSLCGAQNEESVVNQATTSIVKNEVTQITIGG